MIKVDRLVGILTATNLVLLLLVLHHGRPAMAQGDAQVLRGRSLELIDAGGQVRAQFNVEPDGEAVFRIRDAKGTIRVKLGAGSDGSALLLIDEMTEPGIQIVARRAATATRSTTTSINLMGANDQRRTITP
jgi:hypothetical protein